MQAVAFVSKAHDGEWWTCLANIETGMVKVNACA